MANNALKTPFYRSLAKAIQARIADADDVNGWALPCTVVGVTGNLVTVSFDIVADGTIPQVTMPIAFPPTVQIPVSVGDKGIALSASIAVMPSAMGSAPQKYIQPSNLGAMVFLPLLTVADGSPPAGTTVIRSVNGLATVSAGPSACKMQFDTHSIEVRAGGFYIDGVLFTAHTHPVTSAPGNTGGVNP